MNFKYNYNYNVRFLNVSALLNIMRALSYNIM